MPTYEFKKDGDTAVTPIDAPDMATALKLFKSGAAATPLASAEGTIPKPAASELALPEEPLGVLERAGEGVADPAYGTKQLYEHTAGTPESAAAQDAYLAQREERLKRLGAGEGDLARSAGRMVPALAIGALTGGSALAAGLGGAAAEMLNPVTTSKESGDYWEKKINQGLIGGATGFAGGVATKVIGSAIGPALSPEARQLTDAGIQLTPGRLMPGQIAGAITRRAEDAFKSFPILGTFIRGAEGRSLESYNKATVNQALDPIGARVPNNINAGHDAVTYATNLLDQRYDSILRSNPLLRMPPTIWPHLESEIQNTAFLARALPPNEQGLQFQQILQQHVLRNLDPLAQGQPLPGQVVHAIESDLRHFVRTYRGSPNPNDREMARYLDDVRSSIRNALATTNPPEAAALRNTDYAYAMLVRVQDAAARRPTGQGVFTPADMLAVIKKNDPSVRKNSFAQGNALMQDFAEVAQRLLPSKLADSGTPERVLWDVGGSAGLFGMGHPGVLAGLGAASLPYTRPGMALTDMMVRPGPARAAVGNAARNNAGRIGTVMEPQAAGLLTDESGERLNLPQRMLPLGTPGQNGDLPHRAEGGRVSGPTVVGEGGKEIFVPDQPGTIIPNDETEKILARSAIQPSVYDRFVNALHGIREATDPMNVLGSGSTGELGHDALSALQVATFGLKPSVRLTPTTNTTRLQLDGRFARQPVNPMASRGFRNWPAVGGAQAGAAALGGGEEAPAGGKGASGVEALSTPSYETPLSSQEEAAFQQWKAINAPHDSGADYDLRGAFKSGVMPAANGHWPDTFKKPNHPTFSNESQYARNRPELAGRWEGDTYVPGAQSNFEGRWGTLAPPAASPQAPQPLFMQSGEMNVPLSELTVPLPRPKPAQNGKSAPRPKPKAAPPEPNILEQLASALRGIDLSQLVQPVRQGRNTAANGHYEDGGQPPVGEPATVGEAGPELFVPDEPYREMRSLKSPARTQPPVAEGMSTADVSAALHKILFGDPSGSVPMQVDETGMPLALKSVGELREENPGVTHPAVELGAQIGLGQAGGAAATTMAKPVAQALQTAVKSAPYSTAGAGGALGAAVSGSEAGVETDRPAESFEVALPEPNPELLKRREAIEKKMDEAEAAFQTRSAKQYPTAKARDLDAQAHKDKMVGFRQDIKETNEEISQDQTKRKSEKQSEIKAVADLQKAKEERERPLMDRYPSLMALPYLGGAFSAGTAYVNRARQVEQYNTWATRVGDQIKKVATQIEKIDGKAAKSKKPSAETLQMEKDVLRSYANEAPEMQALINPGFLRSIAEKGGPAAGGATLAAELAMVPYQIDYATQQPDTAAGKEARKRLLTLDGWIKTAVSSLAGVTGATAGSTVPTRTKALLPDVKRAEVMSAAAPATATSAAARTNGGVSPSAPPLTAEVASTKQLDPATLLRKSERNKEMLKVLPGGQ